MVAWEQRRQQEEVVLQRLTTLGRNHLGLSLKNEHVFKVEHIWDEQQL